MNFEEIKIPDKADINSREFEQYYKHFAMILMMKKSNSKKFEKFKNMFIAYLYVKLKFSMQDIANTCGFAYGTIKKAILAECPQKLRTHKEAIRRAAWKKVASWENPKSGYNKKKVESL